MNIKLINLPLYYGCDNPGTHLAPMEFSRQYFVGSSKAGKPV